MCIPYGCLRKYHFNSASVVKSIVNDLSKGYYKTLNLHTPYHKRNLISFAVQRQRKVQDPTPEADLYDLMDITGLVTDHLKTHVYNEAKATMIDNWTYIVRIVIKIIKIIKLTVDKAYMTLILEFLDFGLEAVNWFYKSQTKPSNEEIVSKTMGVLQRYLPQLVHMFNQEMRSPNMDERLIDYTPENNVPQTTPKLAVTAITALSVTISIIATFCGYKGHALKTLSDNIRSAKDITSNISNLITSLFDIDMDGTGEMQQTCKALEQQGVKYAELPIREYTTDRVQKIRLWKSSAEDFCRLANKNLVNTGTLVSSLQKIAEKLMEVESHRQENIPHPVPVSLYLWGRPGHGKTEFLEKYLIRALNTKFGVTGTRGGVFDLGSGKYFKTVQDECWAKFDEFGAASTPSTQGLDPTTLNAMISGYASTIPGASLAAKQQTARFNGIFFLSNIAPTDAALGLRSDSKTAFVSRLMRIHVSDPSYDNTSNRTDQPHRKPDFSHLKFTLIGAELYSSNLSKIGKSILPGGAGSTIDLTAKEVVELTAQQILQNQKNFQDIHNGQLPGFSRISDDLWQASPEMHVETRVPTTWISGPPGTGKTSTFVPRLKANAAALGLRVQTEMAVDTLEHPTMFILDDKVDPTTREGQLQYMQFYNTCKITDCIVIISNYGMHSTSYSTLRKAFSYVPLIPSIYGRATGKPEYLQSPCPTIQRLEHGFWRRSGLEDRHYEWYGGIAYDLQGKKYESNDELLNEIMEHYVSNSEIPIIHETPFPRDVSWDIDITIPENCTVTKGLQLVYSAAKTARGAAQIPRIIQLVRSQTTLPPASQLCGMIRQLSPELCVRILTPTFEYAAVKGQFYSTGVQPSQLGDLKEESFQLKILGNNVDVPVTEYHKMLRGEGDFHQPYASVLASVISEKGKDYELLHNEYPLPLKYKLQEWKRIAAEAALRTFKSMLKYPLLIIALVTGAVLMMKFRNSYFKTHRCVCRTVAPDELCPFDFPERKSGRGKKSGRKAGSRHTHFQKIYLNGEFIYEDDAFDSQLLERIWHNLGTGARQGKTQMKMNQGGYEYDAVFDFDDNMWHVKSADYAEIYMTETKLFKKLDTNIARIYSTKADMYVTFITPLIGVLPAHWFHNNGGPYWVCVNGKEYPVRELARFPEREIAFVQAFSPIPGVANITRWIPTIDETRTVSLATIAHKRGDCISTFTSPFTYRETPVARFSSELLKHWTANCGIVSWGDSDGSFTRPGSCGSPLLANIDGTLRLIGVHAAKSSAQRHWCSVMICQELLDEIAGMAESPENAVRDLDVVDTDWGLRDALPVVTTPAVKALITRKRRLNTVVSQGAVGDIGWINNQKPMDSKCKKILTHDFEQTLEDYDQKAPVLDEIDILVNHTDKIPPDAVGLPYVHRIRTARLESNFPLVHKGLFMEIAQEMGNYYMMDMRPLRQLSIEEALHGSEHVEAIDLSTSAGVIFSLIAKIRQKQDFFKDGQPSDLLLDYTNKQYELAKQGIRLALPCDANLKSECLPVEKVWKKRVFYNVPLPTVINLKRLLQPIQEAFQKMGIKSPYLFTLDPVKDWNTLAIELREQGNFIVSLDVSSYDHSLNGSVMEALAEYFATLYGGNKKETAKLTVVMRTFMQEVAYMITILDKTVCQKQGGLPSGCWGTSLIDAAAWELMLYASWRNLAPVKMRNFSCFKENVTAKFVGDDAIISVGPFARDFFHGLSISKEMGNVFHMKVTPATNKDGKIQKGARLEDSTFCSKGFVRLPEHPSIWFPKLKEASIHGALSYTNETSPPLLYEQYIAMRREMFSHGRMRYTAFERELNDFAKKHRIIRHTIMTYDDMLDSAWRLTTSPGINFKHVQAASMTNTEPALPRDNQTLQKFNPTFEEPTIPRMSSKAVKALKSRLWQVAHDTCSVSCANSVASEDVRLLSAIPQELIDPPKNPIKIPGTSEEIVVMQMGSLCATRAYFADYMEDAICPKVLADQRYFLSKTQTDKALRANECIRETQRLKLRLERNYNGPPRGGLYFLRPSKDYDYKDRPCINCGGLMDEPECNFKEGDTFSSMSCANQMDEPEFDLTGDFIDEDDYYGHGTDAYSFYTFSTANDFDTESEEDESEWGAVGGEPSYCCEKKCFTTPWCQVDGIACRKCMSFNYCQCDCVTFQEGSKERQKVTRDGEIADIKDKLEKLWKRLAVLTKEKEEEEEQEGEEDAEPEMADHVRLPELGGATTDRTTVSSASSAAVPTKEAVVDPLAAPALTATPAASLVSQELTDSDNATVPTVLATQGGLEAVGLVSVNYADNIVSLCNKPILTTKFNITASMSAGTIIDSFDFNPWDPLLVSKPVLEYGKLHNMFVGSLEVYLQSYSAATVVGAIIISYLPPELVEGFVPSLENLKTLSSATLNLKEGGCSKITFTGGNLQDAAVSRRRIIQGINYGRIYIAAFTDIVNSYPNEIPIPVMKLCALGPGAYFSHPAYLSPIGGTDPDINPGPTPPIPDTFILDGQATLPIPQFISATRRGWTNFGKSGDKFTFLPAAFEFGDYSGGKKYRDVLSHWYWGSTEYGTDPRAVELGLPNPGSPNDRSGFQGSVCRTNTGPYIRGNKHGIWKYTGLIMNDHGDSNSLDIGDRGEHLAYYAYNNESTSLVVEKLSSNYVKGFHSDVILKLLREGKEDVVMIDDAATGWRPLKNSHEGSQIAVDLMGAIIASEGPAGTSIPLGYVALNPDTDLPFIPAVAPGFSQHHSTIYPSWSLNHFMITARAFFIAQDLTSYAYDLVNSQGTRICTILVNEDGLFTFTADTTLAGVYGMFSGLTGTHFQNYRAFNQKWPVIPALDGDFFISRLKGNRISQSRDMHGVLHTFSGECTTYKEWNAQIESIREEIFALRKKYWLTPNTDDDKPPALEDNDEDTAPEVSSAVPEELFALRKQDWLAQHNEDYLDDDPDLLDDTVPEASAAIAGALIGGGVLQGLGSGLGAFATTQAQWRQLQAILANKKDIASMVNRAQLYGINKRSDFAYAQLGVQEAARQQGYGNNRSQPLRSPSSLVNAETQTISPQLEQATQTSTVDNVRIGENRNGTLRDVRPGNVNRRIDQFENL